MYQIRICRRESEAAVKRSDLANFDPDTYLVPASASLPIAGSSLPPVGRATPLLVGKSWLEDRKTDVL